MKYISKVGVILKEVIINGRPRAID